ncbi:MAG: cellulose biosynthesis protein BcsS [Pseudolabrys sp.]
MFSGTDLWRDGRFVYGGALWSPGGLDHEGFTAKLIASGGLYRYRSGALGDAQVTGTEEELQVLPGWRFKRDRLEFKVFAGLDIKDDATSPYDPFNHLHGIHLGARASADLWFEPTPSTMIAADASMSSIITSYSARAAFGWRLHDWFYLGPEAQTFACIGFTQARLGIHLTGLKTGRWEWSAAAGWSTDSDHRSGTYLRLGVLTRR